MSFYIINHKCIEALFYLLFLVRQYTESQSNTIVIFAISRAPDRYLDFEEIRDGARVSQPTKSLSLLTLSYILKGKFTHYRWFVFLLKQFFHGFDKKDRKGKTDSLSFAGNFNGGFLATLAASCSFFRWPLQPLPTFLSYFLRLYTSLPLLIGTAFRH